ncbi:MAG: TIGR04283 family arsenosugar biosynthesis glycosyltransferase [Bacteroidota bacterium]
MYLSIIIPTLNEASNLYKLIPHLKSQLIKGQGELIVVDGGSTDDTPAVAEQLVADLVLFSHQKGRASQMNFGARQAKGKILYFVHADTLPPLSFWEDIRQSMDLGYSAGTYRSKFDMDHPLLKINAYFTRFDRLFCRGGDQSLFITRDLFKELGGYRKDCLIMEEYHLIRELRNRPHTLRIVPKETLISARKYEERSYWRVNLANLYMVWLFYRGASQEYMVKTYRRLIN